jgi:integrase/recombinase XerD
MDNLTIENFLMTLLPISYESLTVEISETYEQSQAIKNHLVWKSLDKITLEEAIITWLKTLAPLTAKNYQCGMKKLVERGLLNPFTNLQAFALFNHETIVDQIKQIKEWSECTRQARAACYIAFTAFLNRRLEGIVKKATTNKESGSKTFFKVYDKVKTQAMNQSQWIVFLKELEKINPRDHLIAKVILQGGKRVNEVLSLQTYQIDWASSEITFIQSKTKGYIKETVITYPLSLMQQLKMYLQERQGLVFITRQQKSLDLKQLTRTFEKAGLKANIPFKVTPHVLRASTITYLKQQGFNDGDIMKVTGHASAALIYAYDKSSRADNASKKVCLI